MQLEMECTGTSWKRFISFVTHFRKWNPYIIDSLHIEWNISSLYFLKFDDYGLQIMKTQHSVSQKIRILHEINKNNYILNRNVRLLKSMFISMRSILGWAWFCMNYCINAAWHGGNQPVALLRCNEAQATLTVSVWFLTFISCKL